MTAVLVIIGSILMAIGLIGTVLPLLPGAPLVLGGAVLIAWAENFQNIGAWTLVLLAGLTGLVLVVDFVATALGAKRSGASAAAIVGAALGTIIGIFFALPGIILGPFVGAFAGELWFRRDIAQAGRAGLGTWLGLVVGGALKVALVFTMIVITVTARFV